MIHNYDVSNWDEKFRSRVSKSISRKLDAAERTFKRVQEEAILNAKVKLESFGFIRKFLYGKRFRRESSLDFWTHERLANRYFGFDIILEGDVRLLYAHYRVQLEDIELVKLLLRASDDPKIKTVKLTESEYQKIRNVI